jgi:hypothetical protein
LCAAYHPDTKHGHVRGVTQFTRGDPDFQLRKRAAALLALFLPGSQGHPYTDGGDCHEKDAAKHKRL